jgi:hypothetical protein
METIHSIDTKGTWFVELLFAKVNEKQRTQNRIQIGMKAWDGGLKLNDSLTVATYLKAKQRLEGQAPFFL